MAVQVGYEQAGVYSASDDRKINAVQMAQNGAGAAFAGVDLPRAGVIQAHSDNQFPFQTQPDMTMRIWPGQAIVPPDYRFNSDAQVVLTFAPVGASPRTDLVVLRVYDVESGDATTEGKIEVVKGADGGGVPATPPRSLLLYRCPFAANATATNQLTIADVRQYTAAVGGVIVVSSAPLPSDFQYGQIVYDWAADRMMKKHSASGLMVGLANPYIEQWDSPAFGTTPPDGSQLKIRAFYHYGVTDQYGITYIPTTFTKVLVMAMASPTEDSENLRSSHFTKRVSNLGSAGFWCITNQGNGAANQGATLNGFMIGC